MPLIILTLVLILFALLALRFGVDSPDHQRNWP